MPRGVPRKTQTGESAQTVKSVPGQRYGEGVEQQQLMDAMPAPDRRGAPIPGAPSPQPVQAQPPAGPEQIQQFLTQHTPNLLAETQNPGQPVTDGLSTGPGRGPTAIQRSTTPTRRYLDRLAAETGNPKWKRLAERGRM